MGSTVMQMGMQLISTQTWTLRGSKGGAHTWTVTHRTGGAHVDCDTLPSGRQAPE